MARLVLLLPFNTIRAFADAVVCVLACTVYLKGAFRASFPYDLVGNPKSRFAG
jgi:hypothetical protein